MNIILSSYSLNYPLAGIGYYAQYLKQGLTKHPSIEQLICVPGVDAKATLPKNRFLQSQFKKWVRQLPGVYSIFNFYRDTQFRVKTQAYSRSFIYHEPNYILRPYLGPKVCTIHDLSHIRYPECHPKERVKFLLRHLSKSIENADHIITGSNFIRDEIMNSFQVASTKITSIYHGVSKQYKSRHFNEVRSVLTRYHLTDKSYLLSVGTLEPRKNLDRLIRAFNQLSDKQRRNTPLVLVGAKGWKTHGLEKLMYPLLQKGQLYCLGYVSEDDLPYLYSGAYGYIYLSLYEGFGLPLLEAMASGVPTLTANISSMPEVVGNAALVANPLDIDDIVIKLQRLISDTGYRNELKQRGIQQASKFSWETCIENTIAVYQKVINNY